MNIGIYNFLDEFSFQSNRCGNRKQMGQKRDCPLIAMVLLQDLEEGLIADQKDIKVEFEWNFS